MKKHRRNPELRQQRQRSAAIERMRQIAKLDDEPVQLAEVDANECPPRLTLLRFLTKYDTSKLAKP